jgi:hypothetical protein
MTYGRYKDAERFLLEGLKKEPNNIKIHKKLLELYYKTHDRKKFEDAFFRDETIHTRL